MEDLLVDCTDQGVEFSEAQVCARIADFVHGGSMAEQLDQFLPWEFSAGDCFRVLFLQQCEIVSINPRTVIDLAYKTLHKIVLAGRHWTTYTPTGRRPSGSGDIQTLGVLFKV